MDSRYSRQELIFGQDSNKKLKELTIVIYGNGDSLQEEVYKNLCMMGVGKLIIDIPSSMNKYFKVDLNPDCKVVFNNIYNYFIDGSIDETIDETIDVFIVCELEYLWNKISHICNLKNIWFIGSNLKSKYESPIFWSQPPSNHTWITESSQKYYIESIIVISEKEKTYYLYLDQELSDINEGEVVIFDNNKSSAQIIEIRYKSVLLQLLDIDIESDQFQPVCFYRNKYRNHWQLPFIEKGWEYINQLDYINQETYEMTSLRYSLSSYIGSIIANEAIKVIGKGIPYKYGLLYGKHIDSNFPKKHQMKYRLAIVGAGAIGCEILKNIARSKIDFILDIDLFDMDYIEKSNLSRQVLFNESSISTPKAVAAKISIDIITSTLGITNINIHPQVIRIETENIEKLFSEADCVIGAVDSIETRKLIDKYIVWYQKPYFDSGLSGLKGHLQCIIPNKTETFTDLNDIDQSTNEIVDCTIKKFPYTFMHCIKWAEDYCMDKEPTSATREEFEKIFIDSIKELQSHLPEDATDTFGNPFWSKKRQFPTVVDSNCFAEWAASANDMSLWIYNTSKLRAKNYQIPEMSYSEYSKLKIIPSCITTASCIGALTTIELIKYLELECYPNNHFFNLANNLYISSEPSPAKIIKKGYSKLMECEIIPIPTKFSKWDNYIYTIQNNNSTKLINLKLHLEKLYSISIDKIISFQSSVYDSDVKDNSLDLKLKNGDLFEVSGYDTTNNMILMPKIKCLELN